jgi:hypothetical protein
LKAWTSGGVGAAEELILDLAMPLFASEDVRLAIPAAIAALDAGRPRPVFDFKGRWHDERDFALGMQALKRLAQPEDIGPTVAFSPPMRLGGSPATPCGWTAARGFDPLI